jgi:hypothetical protein
VVSGLLALGLVGCAVSPSSTQRDVPEPRSPLSTTAPSGPQAATTAPQVVSKVLVFVVENHSLAQMKSRLPYTFSQAQEFGYATHYRAIRHPSLPNYLAMASGTTHSVADDKPPAVHEIHGPSVFGQALAAGKTASVYADGMSENCATENSGRYAVRHNPWTYFVDERTDCLRYDVPLSHLAPDIADGSLPTVGMVIPDTCNDAHDCSLATADAWLQVWLTKIYAGPDWKSGRLAVVVTADEDDHGSRNTVLTVVLHPSQHHHVVPTPLTHYSLTRLFEDVAGTEYLNAARTAPSMSSAFGLPIR